MFNNLILPLMTKKVSCELVFYFISQMPSKESEAPVIIFSVDIISDDDGENLITMMMIAIMAIMIGVINKASRSALSSDKNTRAINLL